jgi:hypothetical protein
MARLESESTPNHDYLAGFRHAAEQLGAEIELEPGQPGYVEWAQTQIEAARAERDSLLANANAVVQIATEQGDHALAEYARTVLDGLTQQVEQAEFERQAQAEQAAYETQAMLEESGEMFSQLVRETTELIGSDEESVEPQRVLDVAAETWRTYTEQHGVPPTHEEANALANQIVQRTAVHLSNEAESNLTELYDKAARLAAEVPGTDVNDLVNVASSLYQRALFHNGGDERAAVRESLETALHATGNPLTQTKMVAASPVASLHATLNKVAPSQPTPEQPKLEVKVDRPRDKQGRFTVKPLAETYNRTAQEEAAKLQGTQAQRDALKAAFANLDFNVNR